MRRTLITIVLTDPELCVKLTLSSDQPAGLELTTLVVIGTDCKGSCNMQLPYDYDRDVP
jgi:hypothetical protein